MPLKTAYRPSVKQTERQGVCVCVCVCQPRSVPTFPSAVPLSSADPRGFSCLTAKLHIHERMQAGRVAQVPSRVESMLINFYYYIALTRNLAESRRISE